MAIAFKLSKILETDLSYNETAKAAFHKEAKKVLRALADELGLSKDQYDLRSNQGGIAVSGEVTLHTDRMYVQVSQGMGVNMNVMMRTCDGRKDYGGHQNNFCSAQMLENTSGMASRLNQMSMTKFGRPVAGADGASDGPSM